MEVFTHDDGGVADIVLHLNVLQELVGHHL